MDDEISKVVYPFNPMDVVGWKGDLTVWKINMRDIRPIMADTCFRCHGPDKNARMAGMRLDIRDVATSGSHPQTAALLAERADVVALAGSPR